MCRTALTPATGAERRSAEVRDAGFDGASRCQHRTHPTNGHPHEALGNVDLNALNETAEQLLSLSVTGGRPQRARVRRSLGKALRGGCPGAASECCLLALNARGVRIE